MGLRQVRVGELLLLFVANLVTAQWQSLGNSQTSAGLYTNILGHSSVQGSAGLPSQWIQGGSQAGNPAVAPLGLQLQNPSAAETQQVIQQPTKQLTWRFPATPQIPTPPTPVHFVRPPRPVLSEGITTKCSENTVHVEVRKDLLGTDTTANVASFTLGGCAAKGVDASSRFLIYESALHDCNSKLIVTANELVYIFILGMAPVPLSSSSLLRSAGAQVLIECHYPRFHNVSSSGLMPAWIPYASAQAAEELLVFSLRIMMEDWLFQRPSNQYYLGELINIEASVLQFHHVPLRVLVDSCVATPVPDMNAVPRYYFIDNHGCLIDAKLTQSSSHFMPYTQATKLRFQLEAFRFQQGNSSLVYIACKLKATAASAPADAEHKACSFSENRWTAAYGADQVCSCCSSRCGSMRKGRDLSLEQGLQLEKEVSLGPIVVLDKAL
ncbi:zona pellucida sperm-binding protein 3-like [Neoarius graeffei]|uniref:zona pellucida sperm-binding protein 3-like n=1 Tax=Neoarius graeffei TaxID=443677 RepID=UPI00298BF5C6|nr:zona pellucida sperm-binding protein 3-like [Neoarius graeffei]XP_060758432.1 zona pellucida sperm-binding protein 3-like [Neoarius graeffei]